MQYSDAELIAATTLAFEWKVIEGGRAEIPAATDGMQAEAEAAAAAIEFSVMWVNPTDWRRVAKRAKHLGARVEMGRGWPSTVDGRAWFDIVADDGSRCKVILI